MVLRVRTSSHRGAPPDIRGVGGRHEKTGGFPRRERAGAAATIDATSIHLESPAAHAKEEASQ
jgi:hypothetical protein